MAFHKRLDRFRYFYQKIEHKEYFANVFIGLSLMNLLIIVFSKLYFGRELFINFAWFPDDLPGIGLVNPPQGLGAGHYFGDFLLPITVAKTGLGIIPFFPYFPAAALLVLPFSYLPYLFSYFLFFTVFTLINLMIYVKILRKLSFVVKYQLGVVFGLLNLGSIYQFDRGNVQIAVTTFILLGLFFASKKKYMHFAFFISIAGALKLWPFIFLLILLKRKKFSEVLLSILAALTLNVLSVLVFKFDFRFAYVHLLNQWMLMKEFNTVGGPLNHTGAKSSSLLVTFSIIKEYGFFGLARISDFLILHFQFVQVLILIIFLIFYFTIKAQNIAIEYLLIACIILVVPAGQFGYVISILPVGILLLLTNENLLTKKLSFTDFLRWFIPLNLFLLVMVPWVIPITGNVNDPRYPWDLNSVINPVFLSILIIVLLFNLHAQKKITPDS